MRVLGLAALMGASLRPSLGSAQAPVTLQQAVAAGLIRNPDVVFAALRADSSRAEQRIARSWTNPTVSAIPNVPFQYGVGVPIDLWPQRTYRTRQAGLGTAAVLSDSADVVRQVTFAIRQAFFDVVLAQALRQLAAERLDLFRQLYQADSVRLRTGDIPERDLAKSELELALAETDDARAAAAVRSARVNLQALMGIAEPDTGIQVAGDLSYRAVDIPLDSLLAIAMAHRPDLVAAERRIAQSRALLDLARSELVPIPSVGLVYQHIPFENGSNVALGLSLSVPLFYWYGGERDRARAAEDQAATAYRRLRAQLEAEVAAETSSFRATRALIERYEGGLLARSTAALETSRYAYKAGAISLLELLEALRTYVDTKASYYTAIHDYWIGVSALSRVAGEDYMP